MSTKYNNGSTTWMHGEPVEWESWDHSPSRRLLGPCPRCGSVTSTYGGAYSCHNNYCPNSASIFVCGPDPAPDWWNTGINVIKDGDAWCAHGPDFINLQESHAGFGDTPKDAVKAYKIPIKKDALDRLNRRLKMMHRISDKQKIPNITAKLEEELAAISALTEERDTLKNELEFKQRVIGDKDWLIQKTTEERDRYREEAQRYREALEKAYPLLRDMGRYARHTSAWHKHATDCHALARGAQLALSLSPLPEREAEKG